MRVEEKVVQPMGADMQLRQKMNDPLSITSDYLLSSLEERSMPSEEKLRLFLRLASEKIAESDFHSSSIDEFSSYLERFYNYSDMKESEEQAFDLGACWAAIIMYRNAEQEHLEKKFEKRLLDSIRQHQKLFSTIRQKPGIGHSRLAEELGNSPSRLSQIMATLKENGLISSVKFGRNKSYYLTEKATQLIDGHERSPQHPWLRYLEEQINTSVRIDTDSNSNSRIEFAYKSTKKILELPNTNGVTNGAAISSQSALMQFYSELEKSAQSNPNSLARQPQMV